MTDQDPKQAVNQLVEHLNDYLETQKDLVKLHTVKQGSQAIGNTVAYVLLGLMAMVAYVFAMLALAIGLAQWLDNTLLAYGIIALLNLFLCILLVLVKNTLVIKPIQNLIIRKLTE